MTNMKKWIELKKRRIEYWEENNALPTMEELLNGKEVEI